jgi:hypothetical protein
MQAKLVIEDGQPVRLVAARKPRHGGRTLGEFSDRDGRGVERALRYAADNGHKVLNGDNDA